MSISITQTPAQISLAQSPVVFSVLESNGALLTSSSVQYIGELYYWTGSLYNSSSANYTLVKYPNDANTGIFEISNILNSTLSDLLQSNPSNEKNFAVDFYFITSGDYYRKEMITGPKMSPKQIYYKTRDSGIKK